MYLKELMELRKFIFRETRLVRNSPNRKDQEFVLLLKMVICCGVKRKEIPMIKIGDLIDKNNQVSNRFQSRNDKTEIEITEIQSSIKRFLKPVQEKKRKDPLFPHFQNEKAILRYFVTKGMNFGLRDLHKVAVKIYYYMYTYNNNM